MPGDPEERRGPITQARRWLARSLANRITAAALGLALAVALVLGVTSYVTVRAMITRRIQADLDAHARLMAQELASTLNGVERDVRSLAASSLVANGLVDSHGRDAYLAPLLREHSVPGAPGTEMILCDFRGRPIASNLPALPAAAPEGALGGVLGEGPAVQVSEAGGVARLVLSYPIIFPPTRQREGTLVVQVDLDAVFSAAARRGPRTLDATLVAGTATLARPGTRGRIALIAERPLPLEPPMDRLAMRVVLAEDDSVLAPVRNLGLLTALVGLGVVLAVAAAAWHSARGLTGRLARLSDAAREIATGRLAPVPGGGPGDEVDTVATAFNGTLERLRSIQETLEQKVAERTADLLQREQELQRSREHLSLAVEGSQLAVWRWDLAAGQLTYADAWPSLLGYGPGEVGSTISAWAALAHPDDRERIRADVAAHVKGLTPRLDTRFRLRAKDGTWRWIHSRGRVFERDASGRARSIAGTHADVTALEDLHRRLFSATRLASVGTLAAGVAHEINNPLTYLGGNLTVAVELLAGEEPIDGTRRDELGELLEEARDGADRIAAIVRAMRALGGPERGGEAREVDVRSELLAALQMVRNQLVQRATLEVHLADDLPPIRAETNELGRVFLNLLVNAAQAIPEGSPERHRITVTAQPRGDRVVVEVTDTGAGIPPELRERIFEAFFTTKPVGVGMGLGLSIAASIVDRAGGTIEVDSGVGRGSTFRVLLPATHRAPAPAAAIPRPASLPSARRRVLIIDDEPLVGRALERQLGPHHEVEVIASAAEALRRLEAGERWDAILCDLMMTGTDGIAFYEALQERLPALREHVGFVTGGAFGDRATRWLATRDVVVVTKPVHQGELLRAIERLAGAATVTAAPPTPTGR